jgi:hypothetical protein
MNWQAILKIILIGAAGGAVSKGSEILSGSGNELAGLLTPVAAIVAAYLLKQPWQPKAK